jgi:hypothetical protein
MYVKLSQEQSVQQVKEIVLGKRKQPAAKKQYKER